MRYLLPEINRLPNTPENNTGTSKEHLEHMADQLVKQLTNFNIDATVQEMHVGPIITRYEVKLKAGTKVQQVTSLSDELAMALKAKSIRIVAPIPGKDTIGIDIPNRNPEIVHIKEILESEKFSNEPDSIKLVLGKDTNGRPEVVDLTKAPHILMAGRTGAGKSVAINTFMASILASKTPDEVQLLLVDPKMVELTPYNGIPHLVMPVITEPTEAVKALRAVVTMMDDRYKTLAENNCKNIEVYNQKHDRIPYLVIVIDEFADLMMTSNKDVEEHIIRIAQKARAVGIHLILTTQRPTINVVTGNIKANLPTRIGFQTASQVDSRTVMDNAGCEKLLGNGDMMFNSVDSPVPVRLHGAYITEDVTNLLIKHWKMQKRDENEQAEQTEEEEKAEIVVSSHHLNKIAHMLVEHEYVSASLIQRKTQMTYGQSQKAVELLQDFGIIGKLKKNHYQFMVSEQEIGEILK